MARHGKSLGVLVLHGMGSQEPGYSAGLSAALRAALGAAATRIELQEVYWARALEVPEHRLWLQMNAAQDHLGRPIRLRWREARNFVVHSFADALAYHRTTTPTDTAGAGGRYAEVHALVSRGVAALYERIGHDAPVVVLAHSLGAHVISNYIWDTEPEPTHLPGCDWPDPPPASAPRTSPPWHPVPTLVGLVTFGANIPLFSLAYDHAEPIVLPAEGVTHPGLQERAAWLNFLDRDDVLGWPLRALYDPVIQERTQAMAHALRRVPRAESAELGRDKAVAATGIEKAHRSCDRGPSPLREAPIGPRPGPPMHCRRRDTVRRIRDRVIDVGPFLRGLTPLAHAEYWTDPALIRPTAAFVRELIGTLDDGW